MRVPPLEMYKILLITACKTMLAALWVSLFWSFCPMRATEYL